MREAKGLTSLTSVDLTLSSARLVSFAKGLTSLTDSFLQVNFLVSAGKVSSQKETVAVSASAGGATARMSTHKVRVSGRFMGSLLRRAGVSAHIIEGLLGRTFAPLRLSLPAASVPGQPLSQACPAL